MTSAPLDDSALTVGPLANIPAEHLARADGHTLTLSLRDLIVGLGYRLAAEPSPRT